MTSKQKLVEVPRFDLVVGKQYYLDNTYTTKGILVAKIKEKGRIEFDCKGNSGWYGTMITEGKRHLTAFSYYGEGGFYEVVDPLAEL
jgi:hypothetical protein